MSLKILNVDGTDFDLETGLDFGSVRKDVEVIKSIKIKNEGNVTTRSVLLTSSTRNAENEVEEGEFIDQTRASKWKWFSKHIDGPYVRQLNLGDISPGKYAQGTKNTEISFVNEINTPLKEVWNTGIVEFKSNQFILKKLNDDPMGQIGRRSNVPSLGSMQDVEIKFNVEFITTTANQSSSLPFVGVPVRINSNQDGFGYMFMMQYRRNDGKFKVFIYKNATGMVTNIDRNYGTLMYETVWLTHDSNKSIAFKIYNNSAGKPTFEVKYNNENMILNKAYDSATNGPIMSDIAESFTTSGQMFLDLSMYDGDIAMKFSNMSIASEELEQPIYIRTLVGDNAENNKVYNSSVIVSYIQD